jgi:hypothetical protein
MKKLLKNRRGTAEIVGTVLFLIIVIFVFSNVFLWSNRASQQISTVTGDRMNSPIKVEVTSYNPGQDALKVSTAGGRDVQLIRIWIIEVDDNNHSYIDFKNELSSEIGVAAGSYIYIILGNQTRDLRPTQNAIEIDYQVEAGMGEVRFKILTDLGNTATANIAK